MGQRNVIAGCRTGSGRCRSWAPPRRRRACSCDGVNSERAAAPTAATSAPSISTTHSASSARGWSMLLSCKGACATSRSFSPAAAPTTPGRAISFGRACVGEPFDQRLAPARIGHEAHRRQRRADAVRLVDLDAQRQPLEMGEARHHRLAPRRLVVQRLQIVRRAEDGDGVAFVDREILAACRAPRHSAGRDGSPAGSRARRYARDCTTRCSRARPAPTRRSA